MPSNITLPQLIIFGVENAICAYLYADYAYSVHNKSVPKECSYYADAHPIFKKLKQKGVSITFVFDFKEKRESFFRGIDDIGDAFLKISKLNKYVPDNAKWWIYPERESDEFKDEKEFKTTKIGYEKLGSCQQINMLHKGTGIPYSEMLFFDADNITVQDIEKRMGIAVHVVPEKSRRRKLDLATVIDSGIEEYIKVRNKYFQPTTVDTRSYWKKLETILPNNTTLPRLMIFGLESIIGTCLLPRNKTSIFRGSTTPIYPFTGNIRNNRVFDNAGNELHYALEAHEIFQTLRQRGVGITFVFNCKAYVGKDFLEKSQLDKYVLDEAKWWSEPKHIHKIYPCYCDSCEFKTYGAEEREKPKFFIQIHKSTQIPYSEMLFLDGNSSTVRDVMEWTRRGKNNKTIAGYVIPKETSGKLNLITVIAAGIRKYSEIRNEQFQLTTASTKTS